MCMISGIVALVLFLAVDKTSNEKNALKVEKVTARVISACLGYGITILIFGKF